MRIIGAFACLGLALDCVDYATGVSPQYLFSEKAAWLWWLIALNWLVNGGLLVAKWWADR